MLHTNILQGIEKLVKENEKIALDALRFVELLVTLIFDGRAALPKVCEHDRA